MLPKFKMAQFSLIPSLLGMCWIWSNITSAAPPPQMDTIPLSVHVVAGGNANLPCTVRNLGSNMVYWFGPNSNILFNGTDSKVRDSRITITRSYKPDWNIHIRSVKPNDGGVYKCAVNTTPRQTREITLEVYRFDNCPAGSLHLVRMCHNEIVYGNRFTIEFSDFERFDVDNCSCSFIAPSRGNFEMAPTSFTSVSNCGTKIERSINNIIFAGGTVACMSNPFLPADVRSGEILSVTIRTTPSSSRIAPYCYVATFPENVTFICKGPLQPKTASTSINPPTSTNPAGITVSKSAPSSSRETLATSTGLTDKPSSFRTNITTKAESIPITNECQNAEENKSQTNVTGYIVGLAVLSIITAILLSIFAFLIWKKLSGRQNGKGAQIYEQCTSPRDIDNMQTYDELRPQPASDVYLNTVVDKE